jgi:aspartyl protease family protein
VSVLPNEQPPDAASNRFGCGMLTLACVAGLALLTAMFSNLIDEQQNPNQRLAAEGTRVVLERNRFGHYVATGAINGIAVEFMLDTGATSVAVPGELAERIGLSRGPEVRVETANGTARAYLTRLERVSLGGIEQRDVSATITPTMEGDQVLLGMSFLKHLQLTQRGDTLTLEP